MPITNCSWPQTIEYPIVSPIHTPRRKKNNSTARFRNQSNHSQDWLKFITTDQESNQTSLQNRNYPSKSAYRSVLETVEPSSVAHRLLSLASVRWPSLKRNDPICDHDTSQSCICINKTINQYVHLTNHARCY